MATKEDFADRAARMKELKQSAIGIAKNLRPVLDKAGIKDPIIVGRINRDLNCVILCRLNKSKLSGLETKVAAVVASLTRNLGTRAQTGSFHGGSVQTYDWTVVNEPWKVIVSVDADFSAANKKLTVSAVIRPNIVRL